MGSKSAVYSNSRAVGKSFILRLRADIKRRVENAIKADLEAIKKGNPDADGYYKTS